jgi:hypothetical protein
MAAQQREAVDSVLNDLDVGHIPYLCVWNKVCGLHAGLPSIFKLIFFLHMYKFLSVGRIRQIILGE